MSNLSQDQLDILDEEYNPTAEDDAMAEWIDDHRTDLEMKWFASLPPEDVPLDDDMRKYLDDHYDEFYEFCLNEMRKE